MYIEVIHDQQGNISGCYCADTLPREDGSPLVAVEGGLPPGLSQCRLNIDTLTAMEIEARSGLKAVIDPATGEPRVVRVERGRYIMENFRVDISGEITVPQGITMPRNVALRAILRK